MDHLARLVTIPTSCNSARELMFLMSSCYKIIGAEKWTHFHKKFSDLLLHLRVIKKTCIFFLIRLIFVAWTGMWLSEEPWNNLKCFAPRSFFNCCTLYNRESQRPLNFEERVFVSIGSTSVTYFALRAHAPTHWFAFSSRHPGHSVADSELDGRVGWNSGFLVSMTCFNACNFTEKKQFGDEYVVLYLKSSFLETFQTSILSRKGTLQKSFYISSE